MMINRQSTSMLRYRFLVIYLLVCSNLLSQNSYSQETNKDASAATYNKNAIKGLALRIGEPIHNGMFQILAGGYERNISKHSILELGAYYYNFDKGETGLTEEGICIMSGYKYAFNSTRKMFDNTWCNAYFVYFKNTHYEMSDPHMFTPVPSITYLNGIGCSVGRKMYFTKNKNWFFEIGIGASFNIFNIKPDSPNHCEPLSVLPWPIFQIGGKF
jgi:hypothetical protein